ncbi:hypothetical protein V8F20_003708 [Naviculisporaceae sp. PSN 640]
MNSRTSTSALRATKRVHGSIHHTPRVLSFVHIAGYRSIGSSRLLPSIPTHRKYSSQPAVETKSYDSPEQHHLTPSSSNNNNRNLSPQDANPPATTRPPPLTLPTRDPNASTFSYYLATGKAYLAFYKTGLKNVYHNTRLLYPSKSTDTSLIPRKNTRSHLLLRKRWSYDIRRLPIFALLLIVCGEFTPLVVVALPSLVPYTCRLPSHVEKLRKKVEERRAESLENHQHAVLSNLGSPDLDFPRAHLARSLGLVSPFWDKIGWVPEVLAGNRVAKRLLFLEIDSKLLLEAGGVAALEDEEVRLACADRGIDVTGRSDEELRGVLERWLRFVMQHKGSQEESIMRMVFLLSQPEDEWPSEM